MSVEVGTAVVSIVPSLRGFSAKVESGLASSGVGAAVGRATAKPSAEAGAKAGGLFSRAFAKAQSASGSGVYVAGLIRNLRTYGFAISGVVGLTVGLGLKSAASFEEARVAFTTMLGSVRKGRAFFASLVQFAKTTPFDLPGVVSASQKLLAFGFQAKQVLPTLTAIGDASAGLNLGADGLDRITTAIGQISAKGHLQSDELLQLTEAGVPALRILGNEFGITAAQLQTYVTKGLVPASKAIPALLHGIETGTTGVNGATSRFGGLMAKQSKTLGGLFSNLKDSLNVGLAGAVKPLVPVLEHALPSATKAIGRGLRVAAGDMAEFLHGLGVAKDKSKGATTGFERLGSVVRGVGHVLSVTVGFFRRNLKVIAPLAGVVLGAVAALKVFNVVMAITDAVMDANPVSLIVLAIGALAAAFVYAWHKSETFRNIVKGVFHVLETVVGHYVSYVTHVFKFIADTWLSVVGAIVHGAAAAFGWVPGLGGKLKSAAKAFDGFGNHVDGILAAVADRAGSWGTAAGSNFAAGFNAAAGLQPGVKTQDDAQGAKLAASAAAGAAVGAKGAKTAATQGAQVGASLGAGIGKGLDKSASKVKQSAQSLVDKILGPLRALKQKAGQLASSIAQAIVGDTGFGALLGQTDAFGQTGVGTSVRAILAGLTAQRRDVVKFRRELRDLTRRGLSSSAAAEIAGEGLAQGGPLAATLLGATRAQLRQISSLRADTNRAGRGVGNDIAGEKYGKRIAVEVARTRAAVEHASKNTELGPKTVSRLGREFKHAAQSVNQYVRVADVDKAEGRRVAALV